MTPTQKTKYTPEQVHLLSIDAGWYHYPEGRFILRRHLALMGLDGSYDPPFAVVPDGDGGYVEEHEHEHARWTVHRDADMEPVGLDVDHIDPRMTVGWESDHGEDAWSAWLTDHAGGVGITVMRHRDDATVTVMPDGIDGLLDAIADLDAGVEPLDTWEDGLGRSLPQAMDEDHVPDRRRIRDLVLTLHSTGWRPHERDAIQREYSLNDAEVDMLCEMMATAIDAGELPMYDSNYTREDDDDDA